MDNPVVVFISEYGKVSAPLDQIALIGYDGGSRAWEAVIMGYRVPITAETFTKLHELQVERRGCHVIAYE